MSDDSTTQCLLFPVIFRKPVVAQFDQREGSCDGGALLLKAADRHYELVAGLSSCLRDERQSGKVDHSLRELVAQRVFSIACGYPDANDSAGLSGDPIHKLLLDREVRRSGPGFGATPRRPHARFLSVSTRLPSCGSGARRGNRLDPFSGFTNSTEFHTVTTVTAPCLSIRHLEHPDLATLRFLCSTNPTMGIYNPLRTYDCRSRWLHE
jgi:Transposase DDE domain group 1